VDVMVSESRVMIDRDAGGWAIVGFDPDSDRTAVFVGRIGEKGGVRRSFIPDTIPTAGEPIVFDQGRTLIVPSFRELPRGRRPRAVSAWSMIPGFGFELPSIELWRVDGDSARPLGSLGGSAQCGDPVGGHAACVVHRMKSSSLYAVTASGALSEVAQLPSNELRLMALGPGLRAVSSTLDGEIVIIDLAAKRLTRVALPPNTGYAGEARAGPGWAVTLGYWPGGKVGVRSFRLQR